MIESALSFTQLRIASTWKVEENGPKYLDGTSQYILDENTGDRYWNETEGMVAFKLLSAVFMTPAYHVVMGVIQAAFRVFKIISLSHFWVSKESEGSYSFRGRVRDLGIELCNIISVPIILIVLEVSAIYGLFFPYDGRKLYASFERILLNNNFLFYPCFQPNPERHLLGGNPLKRNSL